MTKDSLLSLLRALFAVVGSYLIGHNLLGKAVDAELWQELVGAALTLTGTIWGIASKSTTVDQVESAMRSVGATLGGILVSAGVLSGDNLAAILGAIPALLAVIQGFTAKAKTQQIASGAITPMANGKTVTTSPSIGSSKLPGAALIILLVVAGNVCSAQSLFKPIPKPKPHAYAMSLFSPVVTPLPDSTYQGFRPIASAVYAYSNASGSTLLAGAGISYEHDTWTVSTQKWYTDWSISIQGYAGGSQAPTSIGMVTAVGLQAAFFNKILVVGVGYNFASKTAMPLVGPGISFNN